ncbi:tyrosine-type recombinase/integrase [Paenibacillus brasilensis]|uniref:tyrosine-type recombinase/integrase n=1 Tax=Paenibacillus brasilensis TaxID=128574 RepID=UPI001FCADD1D|nr:tyrosine-type recombinase/integrase [Paenibacillus brasilensis]
MVNSRISELDHSTIKPNRKIWNQIKRDYELYLFLLPIIIIYLVFKYYPMYGIQIAFKDFSPSRGIWGSEWVGFKHFIDFFDSYNFWTIMTNTLTLSALSLVFSFPAPIIIAIMLNQMLAKRYKKIVQTVIYAPHFISTVVLVGMLNVFLSPNSGIVKKSILVRVSKTRAGENRTVYVTSDTINLFQDYIIEFHSSQTSIDHVFFNLSGKNKGEQMSYWGLQALIKRLNRKAEVDFTAHMFRHTCATQLNDKGISAVSLKNLLGHAHIQTTLQMYVHPSDETIRKHWEQAISHESKE